MLLVVDIGNTNITLGIFKEETLLGSFRLTTKIPRTSDEYGLFITDLLRTKNINVSEIEDVIISSVVPNIMYSFTSGIMKYFNKKPIIVGTGTKTGIKIVTANPKEIGPDRIVDAVAAYDIYGGPVIVIDFGTATTYDLILEDGSFAAGITSPGLRLAANALWNGTAKLPEIEIAKPDSILAKDTITSMQAGLVYGNIGQTEYIIRKIKEESKLDNIKVVATGGLGKIIADATDEIMHFDQMLTLKGLRIIYEKCKK
ncbi:type III pantothenate kinase [Anaeromicropila herbilytica]|uniref:Type III pantothenate kinase n=1 Tax=Anaeromicropila herbilytica TaxID=2785025 RepID=A0A7R7ICA1_9FIRM|nr:type III pantothenate kinase [Anaeromicropila herbilytica]BCN29704.1 type III pantothenate kinase [Anaeromicropila herbilytica]